MIVMTTIIGEIMSNYSDPEIVKFNKKTFGIRQTKKDKFFYLDICDAKEIDSQGKRFITWHDDSGEYAPGEEAFGFCEGTAVEVLASWEWLGKQGKNDIEGVPISVDELKIAAGV